MANEPFSKIKNFFRKSAQQTAANRPLTKEIFITSEILRDISSESPANNRLKTIRDLCEVVKTKKLEENAVETLWYTISDLVGMDSPPENRQLALEFLKCLLEGQLPYLEIMRGHFFRVILQLQAPEDMKHRLDLFLLLSDCGKNLHNFEDDTGPFLLRWMPDVLKSPYIIDFLSMLVNIIKFNAAFLDEEIVAGFVLQTCIIPYTAAREQTRKGSKSLRPEDEPDLTATKLKSCMDVLDAVLCYTYLPSACITHFICALCHLVSWPKFADSSWELMKKLLGSQLGYSSMFAMCQLLQERKDPGLLRGTVFFVCMGLWSSKKTNLKMTATAVLPALKTAMEVNSLMVSYEVILSIQRLVKKYGSEQTYSSWDTIMDILETALQQLDLPEFSDGSRFSVELHETLTSIESLYKSGKFVGDTNRFFGIIESCSAQRPESSVFFLMEFMSKKIKPDNDAWIHQLRHFMDKYYKCEKRTEVRKRALENLKNVLGIYTHIYEVDLIQKVLLVYLKHLDQDADPEVRKVAMELLLDTAQGCHSAEYLDILDIVENVMRKPLPSLSPVRGESVEDAGMDESILCDINTAVTHLVKVLKHKLYRSPGTHSVRVCEILIQHLLRHYGNGTSVCYRNVACAIRKAILECFLQLCCDHLHRMGFADRDAEGLPSYSFYVVCKVWPEEPSRPQPSEGAVVSPWELPPAYLEYSTAFQLFNTCLEVDRDWMVLSCVLHHLPRVLRNKALVLSAPLPPTGIPLIGSLCSALCNMVTQKNFFKSLQNVPYEFNQSKFHKVVFPALGALVTYHSQLDKSTQQGLIKCLEMGLISCCAKECVNALRIACLEMGDIMMRHLPSVLLSLSKISANMTMAIPELSFLSGLAHLPKLYVNFNEDQYMSIFAIALPYTNPFKYSHFTASFAHHVIAVWFTHCRMPFRKGFVKYIQKGLKANVLQHFEENSKLNMQKNQDSSDRGRTGSLSETHLRRRRVTSGSAMQRPNMQPAMDEKMAQFHQELTETCMDMMARYVFGNYEAITQRSNVAEFLLAGGQSQRWLLGNKIVTVTTSGGAGRAGGGLCEKCHAATKREEVLPASSSDRVHLRRRHRSTTMLARSRSQMDPTLPEESELPPRALDDLSLLREGGSALEEFMGLGQGDAAVQTGSSLCGSSPGSEDIGDPFHSDPWRETGATPLCVCWCTAWAEIHIRAPSGNYSWITKLENAASSPLAGQDREAPDVTQLFTALPPALHTRHRPKSQPPPPTTISPSGPPTDQSHLFQETVEPDSSNYPSAEANPEEPQKTEAMPIPVEGSPPLSDDSSPSHPSLRKSTSSPSLLGGTLDDFSPRSTASDLLDIPPLPGQERGGAAVASVKFSEPPAELEGEGQGRRLTLGSVENVTGTQRHASQSEPVPGPTSPTHSLDVLPDLSQASTLSPISSDSSIHPEDLGDRPPGVSGQDRRGEEGRGLVGAGAEGRGGVNPSFVFLQLYHCHPLLAAGKELPIVIPQTESFDRAIKILDHINPFETHKIGVIYVGRSQCGDERAILANPFGSPRFARFLAGLGELISLKKVDQQRCYLGGLNQDGTDGDFTYSWRDESVQVVFHVATLMPQQKNDERCNSKKRHIGNDFVSIVYNDSGEDYKIGVIKGQFNYVNIVIVPLDSETNSVSLQAKDVPFKDSISSDIAESLGHTDTKIVTDANLAALVRQIAVHCNLASMVLQRQHQQPDDPFASNWLERLRQIKRIRQRLQEENTPTETHGGYSPHTRPRKLSFVEDFTDYL